MKRKPNSVLRSRTGASITFALLLFLVCAVVGALVLTAGSAAAGRISNLAQSDQRYYSVSSAASLMAEELNGKKVTIVQTREVTTTSTSTYKVDINGGSVVTLVDGPSVSSDAIYNTSLNGNGVTNSVDPYVPGMTIEGVKLEPLGSFLDLRAATLLFGNSIMCCNDAALNASLKKGTEQSGQMMLLHTIGDSDDEDEALTVNCDYYVQSDGTIVLALTNFTDSNDHYSLRLTMTPTINETQSETTKEDTARTTTDSGYTETVTTVTTTTKTSEIFWTVSSVEKVVSMR